MSLYMNGNMSSKRSGAHKALSHCLKVEKKKSTPFLYSCVLLGPAASIRNGLAPLKVLVIRKCRKAMLIF